MEQLIPILPLDVPIRDGGPVYPTSVVEDAVHEFEKRIEGKGGQLGECGLPPDVDLSAEPSMRYYGVDLLRASHIVRHVWIDNGVLTCKVHLFSKFAEMAQLLNFDWNGIPRAVGEYDAAGQICTKYTLITVDIDMPEIA